MVVGCGRVGSSVAKDLAAEGWDVTCVDEDEGALARLGEWHGGFVLGHGMDLEVLERAGAAEAEAAVVATDGDNSNIVIAQVLQRRYGLDCVVLYTAAGANEIPALADEVAGEVRDRIAGLANLNQQL